MGTVAVNTDTTEYRVALIDSQSGMLAVTPKPGGFQMPRIRIPKWTRPAEEINDAVRREYRLQSLVLTFLDSAEEKPTCAVAEVISPASMAALHPLELKQLELLDEAEIDREERASLYNMMAGNAPHAGPFSRPGWLAEAQDWIRRSVPDRAIKFSEVYRQYNAGETFALIRLGTMNGGAYWLKATGDPNKHERAFSVELSRLFPQYLPSLIADREDWNAWVTEDAGEPLGGTQYIELLLKAAESLAELQIRSLGHVAQLRAVGFMDRSVKVMQAHLPEMFAFLEEAMRRQTSTKVKPLERARLLEILAVVDQACDRMQELGIPECLVNGDLNLDNILFDGAQFRFTDWAEGGIGNPFFTLQQLIQHVIREGEHLGWTPRLCDVYKRKWLALFTEHQIDCACTLMPLLAMADYLYGRGDWLHSSRRDEPTFQSFGRTLGRCMDRAAAELSSAEVRWT